jgi:transposase InsO family protein
LALDEHRSFNSAVESFFKSLKAELVWRRNWQTRREVEIALFEYINGFYNPRRKHSALGWKSPVAFEQRAAKHEHPTGTKPVQVQDGPPRGLTMQR